MARIFRLWVELHEPHGENPHMCVETFEQVRRATPNRILHFGYPQALESDDVDYLCEIVQAQLKSLLHRTVGAQERLEL